MSTFFCKPQLREFRKSHNYYHCVALQIGHHGLVERRNFNEINDRLSPGGSKLSKMGLAGNSAVDQTV
jgi:hypothetical protein